MIETAIDRSLAFTALMDLDAGFRARPVAEGRKDIDALLEAWYAQDSIRNLWAFAKHWLSVTPAEERARLREKVRE